MTIFVIANDGTRLMPTFNIKKVRQMLRTGRAVIYKHEPFTIKLTYESTKDTQPIEFKEDAGYQNIGVSICSQKHEYISNNRMMLINEPEYHKLHRVHRRERRCRLRYRAVREDNRKYTRPIGWIPPSLKNKMDQHIRILKTYNQIVPITNVIIETAQFDTQMLKALQEGMQLPRGVDYQRGDQYGYDTLKDAVFFRDKHTCIICKKNSIKDNVILHCHHVGYWKKDRTNRIKNLATVCVDCHTAKNHRPGGKLYGLDFKSKPMKQSAFMNVVKNMLIEQIKNDFPQILVSATFGTITKRERKNRHIKKTHANDAYCMGTYHPKHRSMPVCYKKRRRNNRILEKFYDAKFIDIRDGMKKHGVDLSCNRSCRKESRNSIKNERIYRGKKISVGRRSIRRKRYSLRPGDIVLYNRKKCRVVGVQHYGEQVRLYGESKSVPTKNVKVLRHVGGWERTA